MPKFVCGKYPFLIQMEVSAGITGISSEETATEATAEQIRQPKLAIWPPGCWFSRVLYGLVDIEGCVDAVRKRNRQIPNTWTV
jgi:hypothetical protein